MTKRAVIPDCIIEPSSDVVSGIVVETDDSGQAIVKDAEIYPHGTLFVYPLNSSGARTGEVEIGSVDLLGSFQQTPSAEELSAAADKFLTKFLAMDEGPSF